MAEKYSLVPPKVYNPKEVEEKVERFWIKNNVYELVKKKNKGKKKFYFLDGPPYTSGYIHLGTAWNKVLKDVVIRFYTAKGYDVWRQPGWDMHGLPIEVLVEKKLDIKNKREIEKLGIEKFIEECKKFALTNKEIMTKQFQRLGVWMDWDKPYMTTTQEWIESEWWTFKKAWEKGLIDKDLRVVHWCPRCQTALAEHEIEYKDLEDPSIYVKFPVVDKENEYLLVWTTTPWTLPANVAVLAHPDFDYVKVKVKVDGRVEYWWLVKGRLEGAFKEMGIKEYEIVEEKKGSELDGIRYEHVLRDEYPRQKEFEEKYERVHTVVLGEFVTLEEGTGLVHIAPGHGEEDYEIGKRYNLPVYSPVGKDGAFTEGEWKGIFVKKADEQIIERLRKKGYLVKAGTIVHRYPTCWRCKSPLIFRATEQWFLRVSKIKEKIIEEDAKNVKWLPPWVQKRYHDGVRNVGDWVISRQRYWNAPMPIWVCEKCGHIEVIGSVKELREKSKEELPEDIDLHRPWIDRVVLRCPKCGGDMHRIPDVLDVWFDSAIASWASLEYPRRRELFEKLWPADLIIEGQDQVLKWFYAQQVLSVVAFDTVPYKKVAMHGFVLDAAGSKMSKSLGNMVLPDDVIKRYGADILRLYLIETTLPWEDIRFRWEDVQEVKRVLDVLWNYFYMVATYMDLDNFTIEKVDERVKSSLKVEDKWILSRVNRLVEVIENAIENFEITKGVRELFYFITEDLSRWYGKLVRKRFWIEQDDPVKLAAYYTMYEVFKTFLVVLGLFAPFLAEELYQRMIRNVDKNAPLSVHLLDWPKVECRDEELEEVMEYAKEIVSAANAARQRAKVKIRWPLKRLILEGDEALLKKVIERTENVIKEMTNVKEIVVGSVEKTYEVNPLMKKLGPKFRKEAKKVAEALKKVDALKVKEELEKKGVLKVKVNGKEYEITAEDVEIIEVLPEGYVGEKFKGGMAYLYTVRDEKLIAEGYARDVVRRIQEMRKQLDLNIEEEIVVYLSLPENLRKYVEMFLDYVKRETRARDISFKEPRGYIKEWNIDGVKVIIGVERITK